jgi:hypothetical protein
MPGAVIEPLYLTDPFEGSIANSRHGQSVIGRGSRLQLNVSSRRRTTAGGNHAKST